MFGYPGKLILLVCLLFSHSSLHAETLIPIKIQQGTSLIAITRQFCTSKYHWKEIAKINNLKPPYTISAGDILYAPIELLKGEKLAAKVASVVGGVFIVRNGKKLKRVSKGDFIYPGQTLVTEDDGFTHLIFPDNKYTRISGGTKFTVTYLVRLIDNSLKAEFFLEKGRITHTVKKLLKVNESFITRTPVSVTGVRGTEFRLKLTEDNVNIVETLKGVVRVESDAGVLSLKQGEGTSVVEGMIPEPARLLPTIPVPSAILDIFKVLPVKITAPVDSDVFQYRLRVTTDEKGDNTVLEKITEPGGMFTLLALPDGIYFGFLTAIDSGKFESLPASPFAFEVRSVPGSPLLLAPHDGEVTFTKTLQSAWLQEEGTASYHLQLAKDSDFTNLVVDLIQKETTYMCTNLQPGTYYFRVQAIAADDFRSLYSIVDSWTIQQEASLGPLEGSNKDGVNLRWASMGKGIVYDLQVGKDKDFTELLVSAEGLEEPEFSYTTYIDPDTYYVRVRGVLNDGQVSPWTPPQKLKIDSAPFGIWDAGVLAFFLGIILL